LKEKYTKVGELNDSFAGNATRLVSGLADEGSRYEFLRILALIEMSNQFH
jgi:hypothetical protein